MSARNRVLPAGAEILQGSGFDGTSNVLLVFPAESPPLVLKLYRVRRSFRRERMRQFSNRFIERKRGARSIDRYHTEKLSLTCWLREGFDAVKPIDRPLPAEIDPPALWLEYCPHPRLSDILRDDRAASEHKRALIRQYAADIGRRQKRALDINEPLLIQEHPALDHVFVAEDRLITFDLENGYRPGFSIREAAAQEIAGFLRTLTRQAGDDAESFLDVFVDGYADQNLLRELAEHFVLGRGLFRRIKRWYDRRKRPRFAKTWAMEEVLRTIRSRSGS